MDVRSEILETFDQFDETPLKKRIQEKEMCFRPETMLALLAFVAFSIPGLLLLFRWRWI
jgi:hypothetical protein